MALPTPPTSPGTVASPQLPPVSKDAVTAAAVQARDRYPSPAPTEPSSPVLASTPRMPGIAAALSELPPIPPFNPNSARQQQKRKEAAAAAASASTSRPRPASAVVAPAMTTPAHAHRSSSHIAATSSGVGGRHGADPSPLPPHLAAYAGRQRVYFGPYLLLQTLGEGCVG